MDKKIIRVGEYASLITLEQLKDYIAFQIFLQLKDKYTDNSFLQNKSLINDIKCYHDDELTDLCDYIYVLCNGRILNDNNAIKRYLDYSMRYLDYSIEQFISHKTNKNEKNTRSR